MLSGNPKEVILEEAKKWNADLIVVGSHGRRGFKRFTVRERLRGSRDERALLGCGRARSRPVVKESSGIRLEFFHSREVREHTKKDRSEFS